MTIGTVWMALKLKEYRKKKSMKCWKKSRTGTSCPKLQGRLEAVLLRIAQPPSHLPLARVEVILISRTVMMILSICGLGNENDSGVAQTLAHLHRMRSQFDAPLPNQYLILTTIRQAHWGRHISISPFPENGSLQPVPLHLKSQLQIQHRRRASPAR